MPRHGRSTPHPRQVQPFVEQACRLAEAKYVNPAGCELDCQWNSIEPPADSRGNRRIRIYQIEITSHGPHAIDQQLDSGILQDLMCRHAAIFRRACERAEFIDMFTFNTHRLSAGREQMQCRDTADQFFCDGRRPIDKVFATVENDERWPFLQTIDQGWYDIICLYRHTECCGHGRSDERSAAESTQIDETNLAVENGAHLMGHCDRYRGLADAARPDNRHKLLLRQLHLDRGQGVASSEHPHQARRQSRPRGWFEISRRWRGQRRYRCDEAVPAPGHVGDISPARVTLIESFP